MNDIARVLADLTIVDLSLTLDERFPCTWPGNMRFELNVENWYVAMEKGKEAQAVRSVGPFYTCWMTLHEHIGTHFDAPPHYIPPPDSGLEHSSEHGLSYGDRIPLSVLQGPAAVIDVTALRDTADAGVSPWISVERIQEWEAQHGPIRGEILLLHTAWDEYYVEFPLGARYSRDVSMKETCGWPAPLPETVTYLHSRGVRTLGTDAPSIGAAHDPNPAHWTGLEQGMSYVEGLARLSSLPTRGAYFVFAPVKIADSSGGPGRAFAYV
jgi:kynurenine formamidase